MNDVAVTLSYVKEVFHSNEYEDFVIKEEIPFDNKNLRHSIILETPHGCVLYSVGKFKTESIFKDAPASVLERAH